jgi:hypothetical protein
MLGPAVIPIAEANITGPLMSRATGYFSNVTQASFGGYTLFSPIHSKTVYLIDHEGRVVHTWDTAYLPGNAAYLLDDGTLLRTAFPGLGTNPTFPAGGAGGRVQKITWNGTVRWDFTYSNASHLLHHDIKVMPNGHILMIAWEYKSGAEAIAAGRNPNLLDDGELWPDHVIEVEPDGPTSGKIVWEWHVWDHLVQRYNSSLPNYGLVKDHPELIDLNYVSYARAFADWNHINSVDYNPRLDQVLLSCHQFNEIWVIDHSTNTTEAAGHTGGKNGQGGDLLYRWGNPWAYRAGVQADQKLFRQHNAKWIMDGLNGTGDIMIFNNGPGRPGGPFSSVDEIVPPVRADGSYPLVAGSAYGPAGTKWSYVAPNPTDFFALQFSSAQRLLEGNTLVCDGVNGILFEVTPGGQMVWNYTSPYPGGGQSEMFSAIKYYPPYIDDNITLHPTEDVPFVFNLSSAIADPDTPMGQLVLSQNSSYVTLVGNELRMTYPNGVLHNIINLSVSDPMFTVHREIFVEVIPVNDPPLIVIAPVAVAYEDKGYEVDFNATDIDSPQSGLAWQLVTNARWLSIDNRTGVLKGTPDNGDVGIFNVNVSVKDPDGATDFYDFMLVVKNAPPTITTENQPAAVQGQLYSVDYSSDDEGQGSSAWHLATDAGWLRINAPTGVLNGTPDNPDIGDHWVNVSIDDGNGGTASTNFTLTVQNINDPPWITTKDVSVAYEDRPYSVDYEVMDIDKTDVVFEWTLVSNASFLNISKGTGLLNGTPRNNDVGNYYVNVSVRDPAGATDSHNFTLVVINVNDPPVITSVPVLEATVGSAYTYQVKATDVDKGEILQYILTSGPLGAVMNRTMGLLVWTPAEGQASPQWFVVSVTDPNATVNQSFTVQVRPHLVVSITDPTNGKKVSGKVDIKGLAQGSSAIRLEIDIDGKGWKNVTGDTSRWSYSLDTRSLKNGQHTVRVRATAELNTTADGTATFVVDNPKGFGTGGSQGAYIWIALAIIIAVVVVIIALWMRGRGRTRP